VVIERVTYISTDRHNWLREAGKKAPRRLTDFLDLYAATMPRMTLRYATEHFDKKQRTHYLQLKTNSKL
jgi:hypothetical protein